MRNISFLILFFAYTSLVSAQSKEDLQDYIIEQVQANQPHPSYTNGIFFEKNTLKYDADRIAGKTLTQLEFENIFIYMRDIFWNSNKNQIALTVGNVIDVRDIYKISTTRFSDKNTYYQINVYIRNNYYAKEYENLYEDSKPKTWKYLDKMQILVADNPEVAQKIKKAIILLAKTKGLSIIDGDLF